MNYKWAWNEGKMTADVALSHEETSRNEVQPNIVNQSIDLRRTVYYS